MKLDGRQLAIVLMVLVALIQGVYGIQITTSGGSNGESGSVSMNFDTLKTTDVSSQIAINGATVTPYAALIGPIAKFEQTHSVKDASGKSANVYVKVLNAPSGLTYTTTVLPKEGSVTTQTQVSAEQWLTVPKADSIKCTTTSSYGTTRSASVGLEEAKGTLAGDYVTLTGYYGKALTTGTSVLASQTATSGAANSIKIYGSAKDSSGTYKVDTPLKGISGGKATFAGLSETASVGTTTQVAQMEHVHGTFTSTATYTPITGTAQTKTRTSNYGTEYDLSMKTAQGSLPTGILGYYVKPGTTASKIQGAVNAAQSGDTINVAAGTYLENVNINKGLTLKGTGNPTATSFALNAILGTGSDGITAPIIYVNPTAKIQDGVTLASLGGTVNIAAGTYKENVKIDKSLVLKGAGSTKTIVDGNKVGPVFTIGKNNANAVVTLAGMSITNGKAENVYKFGGGIYNAGIATITGCTISGNTAEYGGGGIYNGGTVTIIGSTISGNSAKYDGGGIYNGGTATITGSTILGNKVEYTYGRGGGIFSSGNAYIPSTLKVTSSTISGNTGGYGGGIYTGGGIATVTGTTVTGSTISRNTATHSGGGIHSDGGPIEVTNSIISGNTASYGGGISGRSMKVTGSTISGNTVSFGGRGGGIVADGTSTITGSTISGNTGEGIYLGAGSTTTTILDSTISGNTGYGGGILNWGTLFVGGTTQIINNQGTGSGGIYSAGLITFDGTQVAVKNNKASLPDTIPIGTPWYKQYGVYYYGPGIPTTTGGFNPATQVTGNTHI
jgi:parallel beta-helix repeat protein